MGSYVETEDQFFDSRDEVTSVSDAGSYYSEDCSTPAVPCVVNGSVGYDFWTNDLTSVDERRGRFLKWMGLSLDGNQSEREELEDGSCIEMESKINRYAESSGAELASSDNQHFSTQAFASFLSKETMGSAVEGTSEENSLDKIRNFNRQIEFIMDELNGNGMFSRLREMSSTILVTVKEFCRSISSSSLVQQFLRKKAEVRYMVNMNMKAKRSWLQKLGILFCVVNGQEVLGFKPFNNNSKVGFGIQRITVRPFRKRFKELSAIYEGQEFCAHKGSILTMKFSPDGCHLASAGKDGIVRVWKVKEGDICDFNNSDTDPSCVSISLNHFSSISSTDVNKKKTDGIQGNRRSSESTCVIFPPKAFQILENPMHEFDGHCGEVLALSWSQRGDLLSSSVDKTVRLWRVGHNQCIRVFPHNNYVTCVEFNPVDDNHFISGSIDGKVRIWEVCGCRVVYWVDIREIVTAVCYYPNGKGGIIGSIKGDCRFYDIQDNHLQLSSQISLCGKKKLSGKRITGFQFSPSELNKVMVTSADSQIRILCGTDIICKFRGKRISGNWMAACFTSDGKHVISAGQDSNVYIWNCSSQGRKSSKGKNIWSCERFFAQNVSIAMPWCGMKTEPPSQAPRGIFRAQNLLGNEHLGNGMDLSLPFCSSNCFSNRRFLLEVLHRGSATWPEEKLYDSSPLVVSYPIYRTNNHKSLKTACQNTLGMWGLVVVTAGWDGWIRTYLNYGLPLRF